MKKQTTIDSGDRYQAGQRGRMLDELRRQIVEGQYAPGEQLPTRAQLVEQFGPSSLTLQRAMDRLADEGFVTQRPRQGTFVADYPPHLYAYGLVFRADPTTDRVLKGSYFLKALMSEAAQFDPTGNRRFTQYVDVDLRPDGEATQQFLADCRAHRVAGLVLTDPFTFNQRLDDIDVPCVAFMRKPDVPGVLTVQVDMQRVLVRALDALQAAGRSRIALLVSDTTSEANLQFFQIELAKRNMTTCPAWIHGVNVWLPHWAGNAIQAVMSGPLDTLPDGLIVTDDHLLPHAVRGVTDSGIRVPEQLSVVGYTNHGWSPQPPLPVEQLGYVASDLLKRAVALIDQQNSTGDAPAVSHVEPVFRHELPVIDQSVARQDVR